MAALLHSDAAWFWGWLCLGIGMADLLIGYIWLDKGRGAERLRRDAPRFIPFLSLMVWVDAVLILAGVVLLGARFFLSPS